jgi:hypothetical protein
MWALTGGKHLLNKICTQFSSPRVIRLSNGILDFHASFGELCWGTI